MPVLLPFRALRYRNPLMGFFIAGEEPEPAFDREAIERDDEFALFVYRQHFCADGQDCVREGVVGLIDRSEAPVYPHEETLPENVRACASALATRGIETSTVWLWRNDDDSLRPLVKRSRTCWTEALDRHRCLHRIERVADPGEIRAIQNALCGKPLFVADGHHRFAAGWNLATIQIRTAALRTRRFRVDDIERNALAGRLLPPKSTDFYPKLAGGLVMFDHFRT